MTIPPPAAKPRQPALLDQLLGQRAGVELLAFDLARLFVKLSLLQELQLAQGGDKISGRGDRHVAHSRGSRWMETNNPKRQRGF